MKQILVLQDYDSWSVLRAQYLPTEYQTLYKIIDAHCTEFHEIPSIESLKFSTRDTFTKEKLCAIEAIEVDTDAFQLLQYLKNEYTQREILISLEDYVDNSVAFETADESIDHLHQIILDVEKKVDLEIPQESMKRIALFESDEELGKYLSLGLNKEFDFGTQFSPRDLILIGGRRGAGKSITCANVATNVFNNNKSAIYFTIEMDSRSVLQRVCSISTGVSATRLHAKNLSVDEWEQVATWWASRFVDGEDKLTDYRKYRDFDKFHASIIEEHVLVPEKQLDVIYDPSLTVSKIRAELDKKIKGEMDIGVIIIDYINKLKLNSIPSRRSSFDWIEQIEVSKALKLLAQDFGAPVFSPYQIDATGEARFAKGILDDADAAYILDAFEEEDACMQFKCTKMREGRMISFTSTMDWNSLKIGPESALTPTERDELTQKIDEPIHDM